MSRLALVANQILAECKEDYVGLWSIIRTIQHADIVDSPNIMETTLLLLKQLLSQKQIIAGQFLNKKFVFWKIPPEEAIKNIEREWKKLGRDPNIGEIAWFIAT